MSEPSAAVAVVGMALRVPGASTPEQFWANIVGGKECIRRWTRKELEAAGVRQELLDDPFYVMAKPIIDDVESFDAAFFDLTPYEVERMDPGHRLFLECAWEAMERAGESPNAGVRAGVFGGVGSATGASYYARNIWDRRERLEDIAVGLPVRLGTNADYMPARVSYKLNLNGPSFSVQAACATSLVAIHLATRSLRTGECDLALAGGATVSSGKVSGYLSHDQGMLSRTGHVYTFDERAEGTVFGNGVGVVVLKRLDDALRDRNPIIAVIRGSATNNDGLMKASFTAPSVNGQMAVIGDAFKDAGVSPDTIGYVETHGTGTKVGDPIEVTALTQVHRRHTDTRGYCALGAVKPNVGHLAQAAGVVGFIKACLVLQRRTLPPCINYERPNPKIDFEASPFYVQTGADPWEKPNGHPRRAGVSAFGFGGSNVHAVLEEAPEAAARPARRVSARPQVLVLSAKTETALARAAANLGAHLEDHPQLSLESVAHTLQTGRAHFTHRAAAIVDDAAFAPSALSSPDQMLQGEASAGRPIVFLFPGQGAQRPGMGQGLYAKEPVYRRAVDRCAEILVGEIGFDIRELLHPGEATEAALESAREALRQTANTQPALFTVEYALAQLFMSWGIRPATMLGHSIGEYVAACVAGVFSLEDALRAVAQRGSLMQRCQPGAMLAVFLPEAELVEELSAKKLPHGVELAAVNGPALSVVSGTHEAIAELAEALGAQGIKFRQLQTSHGFHSAMMEPALEGLRAALRGLTLKPPAIPFVSNLTGKPITDDEATDPEYWVRQLRHAVRFSSGLETVLAAGDTPLFVELGPGAGMSNLVGYHTDPGNAVAVLSPSADADGQHRGVLAALCRLWVSGAQVDWAAVSMEASAEKVELPTYPFERFRMWLDAPHVDHQAAPQLTQREGQVSSAFTPAQMYEVRWRRAPYLGWTGDPTGAPWLLFRDRRGLAEALERRIEETGDTVVSVVAGEGFYRRSDGVYSVRPGEKEDLQALIDAVTEKHGRAPERVLHLWSVTGASGPHNTVEAFDRAADECFHTLVALAQVASELGLDDLRLLVVSDGLYDTGGGAAELHAEKSIVAGPARVIPGEVQGLRVRSVDVPYGDGDWDAELLDAVLAESAVPEDKAAIALRADGRYFEATRRMKPLAPGELRLRQGGTVLVTGGTGGLGLAVARHLFEARDAKLALLSRWEAPPRSEWGALVSAGSNGRAGYVLPAVLELEEQGAEVMIVSGDVSDRASLAAAIERVRSRFGAINGVIHAAGVLEDGPVLSKTREDAERVFAPKVRGALLLDELLEDAPLDFFVNFSSISSHVGGDGRVDYAAANAVLDAVARRRSALREGLSCSIGWDAWRHVGMAAATAEKLALTEAKRRNGSVTAEAGASPDLPDVEVETVVEHPFIQYRQRSEGDAVVYGGRLEIEVQWVLHEHVFSGQHLLPGTAIIESVRAAFAHYAGSERIELSEVVFVSPLVVGPAGALIEVALEAIGAGTRFEFRSRALDGASEIALHATGFVDEISPEEAAPVFRSELDPEPHDRSHHHSGARWHFGSRWENRVGQSRQGDESVLDISLREDLTGDLDQFGLHPSLFDTATGQHNEFFVVGYTLPFSFGAIRVFRPLPANFRSYARHSVDGKSHVYDMWMVDPDGNTLVEVKRYTKRIVETAAEAGTVALEVEHPFQLTVGTAGDLDSFALTPMKPRAPGPGEVQIDVVAAGINFRDVLAVLGTLPGYEGTVADIGSECSGRVTAVGDGVPHLEVGDAVVAFAVNSFASTVTTDARFAVRLPESFSLEKAAGIPIAWLTADWGLNHLAHMGKGERVLIHSASGGVGLAAVQLAQVVGAEIFATAGNPLKRAYLRELGIEHVMDSRSMAFVEEIREITKGEGVDVVLNSLAGDFIPASLGLLRHLGRFVEIGKRDIYSDAKLGLYPFRQNLSYFAVDLGPMRAVGHPPLIERFNDLIGRFGRGELVPSPTTVHPIDLAGDAFSEIARTEHVGKLVLKLREDPGVHQSDGRTSIDERFRELFGEGIGLDIGLDALNRVLAAADPPSRLIVSPREPEFVHLSASGRLGGRKPRPKLETAYREAESPEELALVPLWQDALGVEPIGVDDDFFALAGNSLTAIHIIHAASKALDVKLPGTAVFDNPTIAKLANAVRHAKAPNEELEEVESLLSELETMSDEEVAQDLAELAAGAGSLP